jgi:hypothetical protein
MRPIWPRKFSVVYLRAVGNSGGPVRSWSRVVNQPVMSTPIGVSGPRSALFACLRAHLAREDRAMRLQKIPLTWAAIQLSPGAAAGMTIRTEIAEPHPTPIRTVRIGTEMQRSVHLARASPVGGDRRWWDRRWQSLWFLRRLLAGRTGRLVDKAGKRLRVARALAGRLGRRGCPLIPGGATAWPCIVEHDTQPQESSQQELIENQVGYHGKIPLTRW